MNTILSRSKTFLSALRRFFARTLRRIAAILASPQFKKFAPLAILIIIIGIAVPMHFVHAAQPSGFFGWLWGNVLSQFLGLIGAIIVTIINIILLVFSYVAWLFSFLAKGLLNQVIDPAFSQSALHVMDPNGPVAGAWNLLDGLANIVIIFAVLFMGIGTMLDLPNYNWKALLPKVVIAAILINFSLAIVGFGIDIAQVVMNAFLVNTGNKTTVDIITGALAQNLNSSWSIVGGALLNWPPSQMFTASIGAFMTMLAYLIFTFLSIFFYLLFFLYLLARVVALWLLAMVSPLAFAMNVIPSTQQFFNKWKTELINWLLIGPLMAATLFFAAYFIKSAAVTNPPISQTSTAYQTPTSNSDLTDPNTTKAMQSLQLYSIFPELFALLVLYFGYKTSKSWSAAGASFISGQIDRAQKATTNYAQKAGKHYGQQGYSRAKQATTQRVAGWRAQRAQNRINAAAGTPNEAIAKAKYEPRIRQQQERAQYAGLKESQIRAERAQAFKPKFLQQRDKEYAEMLGMASNDFVQDELRHQSNLQRQQLAAQQASKRNMIDAFAGLTPQQLERLRTTSLALKDTGTANTILAVNPQLWASQHGGTYSNMHPDDLKNLMQAINNNSDKIAQVWGRNPATTPLNNSEFVEQLMRRSSAEEFKKFYDALGKVNPSHLPIPPMQSVLNTSFGTIAAQPTHQDPNDPILHLFANATGRITDAFNHLGANMDTAVDRFVQRMKAEDFKKIDATSTADWNHIAQHIQVGQINTMVPQLNNNQRGEFGSAINAKLTAAQTAAALPGATSQTIAEADRLLKVRDRFDDAIKKS